MHRTNRHAVTVTGLFCSLLAVGLIAGAASQTALAQEEQQAPPSRSPLFVLHVAGVERVLNDVDFLFAAADRPELSDVVVGQLARVGDLKGVHREQPFGLMAFLEPGFPPRPTVVGYLPVENLDDLLKTMTEGPITVRKVEGRDDRLEVVARNQTLHVQIQDGYALVSRSADILKTGLPQPAKQFRQLTDRYDLALSLNLNSIPEGTRTVFLELLRNNMEAQLQQRDNEPESRYRIRRARGMSNLEFLEQLLTQGEQLTFGFSTSANQKRIVLDLILKAQAESEFARQLSEIPSGSSQFRSLLAEKAPLSLSFAWNFQGKGKDVLVEAVRQLERQVLAGLNLEEAEQQQLAPLFDSLRVTAEKGLLDGFLQFRGTPSEKFVLLGGIKLEQGESFGNGLTNLVRKLQDHRDLKNVDLNAAQHQGVSFHRLVGNRTRPEDERLYGEQPSVYLGADRRAAWFAIGGENALPALRETMDQITDPESGGSRSRDRDVSQQFPFAMTLRLSDWLALTGGGAEQQQPRRELLQRAFQEDNDELTVEVRPTEDGLQLRIQFDEGFARFLGLGAAREIDRRQ